MALRKRPARSSGQSTPTWAMSERCTWATMRPRKACLRSCTPRNRPRWCSPPRTAWPCGPAIQSSLPIKAHCFARIETSSFGWCRGWLTSWGRSAREQISGHGEARKQVAWLTNGDYSNLHVLHGQDFGGVLEVEEEPHRLPEARGHRDLDRDLLQSAAVHERQHTLAPDFGAGLLGQGLDQGLKFGGGEGRRRTPEPPRRNSVDALVDLLDLRRDRRTLRHEQATPLEDGLTSRDQLSPRLLPFLDWIEHVGISEDRDADHDRKRDDRAVPLRCLHQTKLPPWFFTLPSWTRRLVGPGRTSTRGDGDGWSRGVRLRCLCHRSGGFRRPQRLGSGLWAPGRRIRRLCSLVRSLRRSVGSGLLGSPRGLDPELLLVARLGDRCRELDAHQRGGVFQERDELVCRRCLTRDLESLLVHRQRAKPRFLRK